MCGIFGYVNYKVPLSVRQIVETLLLGLKKIEYRGYDSAGLCLDAIPLPSDHNAANDGPTPLVIRSVGNIDALRAKTFADPALSPAHLDVVVEHHVGVAHTRWATHGEVCEANCHPQQSNDGAFSVVHNGMMTNHQTIKTMILQENGYTFRSNTDTEVIAVLAEYLYTEKGIRRFTELTFHLTHFIEGAYALLIRSSHFPGELMACRRGSPLVIGVREPLAEGRLTEKRWGINDGKKPVEIFFASDPHSFAAHTRHVVYLEDGDIAHYRDGAIGFYNPPTTAAPALESEVSRRIHQLDGVLESLSKGGFAHFMLKEIHEQAGAAERAMRGRVNFVSGAFHFGGFSAPRLRSLREARRVVLIACGTSMFSAMAVRPVWEELVATPVAVENASDFVDRGARVGRLDACVFISQSGETADVLRALEGCREAGAVCVGITNVVGSSVSRMTDFGVHLNAGTEVGVASTKAYTSQVVVLSLIALLLSQDSRALKGRREAILQGLSELPAKITQTLHDVETPIQEVARQLQNESSLLVLGRGYDYATVMEAALKLKETTYIHAEGISFGELKHGSLALVDPAMRILAICSDDKHAEKCKSAIQQVSAREGRIILITNYSDPELTTACEKLILVPKIVDCLQCILNVIPFQLLAYHTAVLRGNNVDCPRNLAKCVTVE
ncbi:unnamed protein product [Phytomonas sp. Hart1]|nr:unnamed protein product [Phytomonas sp. Hart1]|eukprot:CCW71185.1 unnamed protein product [Phytomonas sp. isolate Hart1]